MKPSAAYVIASYNHERYIERAIASVLSQTAGGIELIVVDDGSTDKTYERAVASCNGDRRCRVFRAERAGVVAARNRGVESASADLVSILDSDDTVPAYRTQVMLDAFAAQPEAVLMWGDAWIINEHDDKLGRFSDNYPSQPGDFSVALFSNYCFVPSVSVMFRKDVFLSSGGFWGPGPHSDYLKWIELGCLGPVHALAPATLGGWRWHAANTYRTSGKRRSEEYGSLRAGLMELVARNPGFAGKLPAGSLSRRLAQCHFMAGFHAARDAEWQEAGNEYRLAFQTHRSLLNALAWASCTPLARPVTKTAHRLVDRFWFPVRYKRGERQ